MRPASIKRRKMISVFLPQETVDEIQKVCEKHGSTMSAVIRMIVMDYFAEKK